MRVLILDGNENQAVACTRSLGRAGHEVVVGAPSPWSKAGWSRFCSRQFRYVAPERDMDAFVASVVQVAAEVPETLVLPMTERASLGLSEHREALDAARSRYVLPAHATLLRSMDKQEMTNLARALGVDTPATALLTTMDEARAFAGSAPYPVVLKPRSSEEVHSHSTQSTGRPLYARSPDELLNRFTALKRRATHILAQEYVEGDGAGYFVLMRAGEERAEFAHRRLRDVRPTGSGSALRVSVAVDPRVRDAALRILRELRWHGVAMVEFRLRQDGTPVFLEVNGRFWNSLALAIHAGVDFPGLLVKLARDGDVEPDRGYHVGVRCRWLLGDVRHLVAVLKGRPAGYEGHFPRRLPTLMRFLTPVPGTFHDNFMWDDPLPELGDWLDFVTRRVPGVLRSRRRRSPEPASSPVTESEAPPAGG
jgi:predicted ATP-grasp superfamily ATP-dependent carboligase